jgi:HK97 family phage major capsid protein
MKYAHIISEVLQTPWAILDSKFSAIEQLLALRASGDVLTEEEIRVRVGESEAHREPYCLAGGERLEFAAAMGAARNGKSGKLLAVIPVYGVISARMNALNDISGGTSAEQLTGQVRQALANPDVQSIVLDFDSPGGSVHGIDELATILFEGRSQKPIIAQVNPLCASAAYYLASQASEIVMMPSGAVGSIGVRLMHQDLSKALEMKGVKITHISAGKFKTEGDPTEPLGDEARAFLQKRVDEYYGMFVDAVARGRGVKSADVRNGFGQGRVVGSADAKRMGMVDRIGTMDDTIARWRSDAKNAMPMAAQAEGFLPLSAGGLVEAPSCLVGEIVQGSFVPTGVMKAVQEHTNVPTAEAEHKEVLIMSTVATPAAAAATVPDPRAAALAESDRCNKLVALAKTHNVTDKLNAWINDGTSVEAAQNAILADLRKSATSIQATTGVTVSKDADDKVPGSVHIVRMARLMAGAKGNKQLAAQRAQAMGDGAVAAAFLAAVPQNASNLTEGGAFVPENWVPDMIEFLRPLAVFRALNPTGYPLVNGNLTLPKLTSGGTASYVGEKGPIPVSEAKSGTVKGSAKKLAAIIPISNDLIRYAGLSVDEKYRQDMFSCVGQTEDATFFRAAGTVYTPKGLRYQALPAGVVASSILKAKIDVPDSTTSVLKAVLTDLSGMLLRMANSNVRFLRPGWGISRRTEFFLKYQVLDGLGRPYFKDEMDRGMLMGYPYKATSVIPNNLGASTYDSEIYLADFADVIIADVPNIAIEVSNEAAYVDADGATHNAFQEDSTLIRLIEEHDLMVRHEESVQVLTTVQYGA